VEITQTQGQLSGEE